MPRSPKPRGTISLRLGSGRKHQRRWCLCRQKGELAPAGTSKGEVPSQGAAVGGLEGRKDGQQCREWGQRTKQGPALAAPRPIGSGLLLQWSSLLPTETVFHLAQDSGVSLPPKHPLQGLAGLSQKALEGKTTQISVWAGETWGNSRFSLQGRTSSLGELGPISLLSDLVWGLGAPANTSHRPRVPTIHQLPLSRRQGRSLTDEIFIIPIYFLFVACVCIRVQAVASGAQAAAEIPTNVAHEYSTAAPATLCSH